MSDRIKPLFVSEDSAQDIMRKIRWFNKKQEEKGWVGVTLAWAVFDPDNQIIFTSIFPRRPATIFMVTGGRKTEQWGWLYRHGYRVRRIKIELA
jgi:hypothetical protein